MEQRKLPHIQEDDTQILDKSWIRVLVCGGRAYDDYRMVGYLLDKVYVTRGGISHVIHGGAGWVDARTQDVYGADLLAGLWARQRGVSCSSYEANWALYGKAAGPKRNQRMLDEGKPDLVVAFPGGRGTADMVKRAQRRGLEVLTLG